MRVSPFDDRVEAPEGAGRGAGALTPGAAGDRPRVAGEGAAVLARIGGDPLLVVGDYGDGRALAWTSDVGPHWCPEPFTGWEGYRALREGAVGWLTHRLSCPDAPIGLPVALGEERTKALCVHLRGRNGTGRLAGGPKTSLPRLPSIRLAQRQASHTKEVIH